MDRQLIIHRLIEDELRRCESLYNRLESQLKNAPAGSLVRHHSKYYRATRESGKQCFIPLQGSVVVNRLKTKRYIKEGLPLLRERIKACSLFLKHDIFYDPKKMEHKLPSQYQSLADTDIFLENDINIDKWKNNHYKRNPMEIPVPHYTANGCMVRFKSEAMIGTALEHADLLYICEPELMLGHHRVYPDFAVFLPTIRRIVYWEHLGIIDDPQYIMRNMQKLDEYARNGIYLGINLIITWETRGTPLTSKDINDKIQMLFTIDNMYS